MNKPQQNQSFLSIRGIQKYFGYKQVLKSIDLDFHPQQVSLLIGKNGAGKSTLVKILTGLMRQTSGEMLYNGVKVQDCVADYRNAVGVISHEIRFYGDLTGRENLEFFGKLRPIENLNDSIELALIETGLQRAADAPVKTYSSGMSKRLNIARLMISNPKLLFLDEPYSGLDFDSIEMLNDYIDSVRQKGGAVLLISHQVDSCFDHIDRAVYLVNGIISHQIPKSELQREDLQKQLQLTANPE